MKRLSVLQTVVSVVSLAAVVWWATRQEPPTLPHGSHAVTLLCLSVAVYALTTLARAERWHRILEYSGVETPRSDSYGLTLVGYMGNNVLPARGGELLRTFMLAPRTGASRRNVLGTIVAERVLDATALGLFLVVLIYAVLTDVSLPSERKVWIAIAAALALVLIAAAVLLVVRRELFDRARAFAAPLWTATRRLGSFHGLMLLGMSVVIWALEAAVYLGVARAVGLDMGMTGALFVVAVTNLFAALPAAPGYLGTFDAAVAFSLKTLGLGSAVSYLLLLRFVLFVPITLVGLGVLVVRYGGWSSYRAARLEASRA